MIQGKILRDAMISASNCLSQKKQSVDELNIFPVPDGDTGTNMSMTLSAAARELARLQDPTVSETADTASAALLRGARGNSGVILSLLFRGFSKGLKGKSEASGADLAAALGMGVEAAYKAVMKPTEGTILTVAREAAEKAIAASSKDPSVKTVWAVICDEAEASLARTPDLLPVLKKAGVVDAGGQGLCIILRAMQDVFGGGAIVEGDTPAEAPAAGKGVSAAGSFEADITFTYCTEFIVARDKGNDRDPLRLRAYLESIGDCVVVVDDEEIIKVHVHTNDPGLAIQRALTYGALSNMKIDNMRLEHQEKLFKEEQVKNAAKEEEVKQQEHKEVGFISVSIGEGLNAIFKDLGVDQIIEGGQTMNPSTDDILHAIDMVNADTVFVFPNNKNIIMAANQAKAMTEDKEVIVIPTKNIPQGITAVISYVPEMAPAENEANMTEEITNVATGQVTYAVRDTEIDGMTIHENDIMGIGDHGMLAVGTDIEDTTVSMVNEMLKDSDAELISIYYGQDVTEEAANALCDRISKGHGDCDVELQFGGQPVYYYVVSAE